MSDENKKPGYIKFDDETSGFVQDTAGRVLGDTRHVATHLGIKRGLTTVVIPPHTDGGVPDGFNPHDVDDMKISFDPGRATERTVTVRQLRAEITGASSTVSNQFVKAAAPAVVQTSRGRDMRAAAEVNTDPRLPSALPVFAASAVESRAPFRSVVSPVPTSQQGSLAAAFAIRGAEEAATIKPQESPQLVEAMFEIQNFGSMSVRYADVIKQGAMLILVYDKLDRYSMRFFPSVTPEGSVPNNTYLAAGNLPGSVFQIETTGVQFSHGRYEYCVLFIVSEASDDEDRRSDR